jgi:hypothetical protein
MDTMLARRFMGRKRHILVDTMGLILAVVVHSAGIQDRDGAKAVFEKIRNDLPWLQLIWAVGGYAGKLVKWVKSGKEKGKGERGITNIDRLKGGREKGTLLISTVCEGEREKETLLISTVCEGRDPRGHARER